MLLEAKIALEDRLRPKLFRVLRAYIITKAQGHVPIHETMVHRGQIGRVLLDHYARCILVATARPVPVPVHLEDAALTIEHLRALKERAHGQAQLLTLAIDREFARADGVKSIETKAESYLAKAKAVMARVRARISAIVNGQTQAVVEEARGIEAGIAAGNRQLFKRWSTMNDHMVRNSHVDAEGQERHITQPYDIGASRLMFPGDSSMGADLSEVINCRCSSIFYVRNPDGSTEELARTNRLQRTVSPNRAPMRGPQTAAVVLREGAIASVFLADGIEARITIRNGVFRVTRPGSPWTVLARGRFTHGYISGRAVRDLTLAPDAEFLGIQALINRSLAR